MASPDEERLPEVPGYTIEKKLAQGGMGVVYTAHDDALGRRVAIKMIRADFVGSTSDADDEKIAVARFMNEARAAAQIKSAHVAHVLTFGQTKAGDLYLVLEFLDGVTLNDVLKKEKALDPARAVHLTQKVCRGLKSAHALGIVHRDLKPSNIMLVDQDGDPEFVKILDFGVAKKLADPESDVTRTGALIGTHTSMAPEQITGDAIDARTDVYAVGCLLYRLLTGKPPFTGQDFVAILHAHLHRLPPPPSKVRGGNVISPAIDAVVMRCLAKAPADRPSTMDALDRALDAALAAGADRTLITEVELSLSDLGPGIDVDAPTLTPSAARRPTGLTSSSEAAPVSSVPPAAVVVEPVPTEPTPMTGTSASRLAVTGPAPTPTALSSSTSAGRYMVAALAGSMLAFGAAVFILWLVMSRAPSPVAAAAAPAEDVPSSTKPADVTPAAPAPVEPPPPPDGDVNAPSTANDDDPPAAPEPPRDDAPSAKGDDDDDDNAAAKGKRAAKAKPPAKAKPAKAEPAADKPAKAEPSPSKKPAATAKKPDEKAPEHAPAKAPPGSETPKKRPEFKKIYTGGATP